MDAVEDIKARLAIEDVISEYVELKRAGRNYKALSPFGNEKTPSFMISPEKQIWHDFSSGKGGNMFSFVMEMEGVDFKGALEILARKAGVDLTQYRSGASAERGKQKERLYKILELATRFYQVQFSKNQAALTYVFKKRQFTKQIVLDFQLGYAPNTGRALLDYLVKKGFSEAEVQQAGLATKRYSRANDMFRGRVMIPLSDAQGRVVGFTARLLVDDPNAPKYINTPQTLLYDKGRQVYGFHLAKEAIRKTGFAVVVEGNLDVIASHQASIANVVATAGTAMTPMHLKELGRFTHDVRLAFDQDEAGLKAAERAIPLANQAEVSLSIITVPSGKDPDELIRQSPETWQGVINQHQYAMDWLIERLKTEHDITTAPGKRQFSDACLAVIRQLQDSVEQDHYLGIIATELGIAKEALRQKLERKTIETPKVRKKVVQPQAIDKAHADQAKAENQFLSLMLALIELRTYLKHMEPAMFQQPLAARLLAILTTPGAKQLPETAEYEKILAVVYEELYANLEVQELRAEAARLQVRLIENYVKRSKAALVAQLDEHNQTALLTKVKALDNLLNLTKESIRGNRET